MTSIMQYFGKGKTTETVTITLTAGGLSWGGERGTNRRSTEDFQGSEETPCMTAYGWRHVSRRLSKLKQNVPHRCEP